MNAKKTGKPKALNIELRSRGRVNRERATLLKVSPRPDPWEPGKGVVDLLLLIPGEIFPATEGWYRLADPLISAQTLEEQVKFIKGQISKKRPVVISENPGRSCKCGQAVTASTYCPSCGSQVYAKTAIECSAEEHGRLRGRVRFCPFCGYYLGHQDGMGRIGQK